VKRPRLMWAGIASVMLLSAPMAAAKPPDTWDGLVQVKPKRFQLAYLQPGADFRGYTKVLIEPTEIAFAKNWQRDYNRGTRSLSSRVSDSDVEEAISKAVPAAHEIFVEAWTKGGFGIANEPGPDVLRVKTGVLNISVSAPDQATAGRSYNFSGEAGSATFFVEVRDSVTGALLGRVVDQAIVGDNSAAWRTASSNRSDFRRMVERWADASVRGMSELKSMSPVAP
jgi:hypothetical protein